MFAGQGDVPCRRLTMEEMSCTDLEDSPQPNVPNIDSSEHDGWLNLATKFIAFTISVNFMEIFLCIIYIYIEAYLIKLGY